MTLLRWYRLTPGRFVAGLLGVECLLWLSDRFHWFAFNAHKGWTVLIAAAAVGATFLLMLLWLAASLLFRRRFQFSIRSLLALTVAVALPCSWLSAEMNSAKRQGETIQSLERVGGHVYYDYEFDESGCLPTVAEPAVPSWLLRLFGRDQFATVVLAAVEGEAGLDYVRDLHDLQILRIGSADFPPLLPWAKNAPATLLVLRGRNRYYGGESTGPHYPKLNPESLEHLGALADLRRLELSGFWIDRAGLDALASLRQLRRLSLSDMLLEDEDRQEIIDLNQPSDFGLESLERLTQLQELDLGSIHLTDSGKERLQRALPNCRIERW